MDQDKNFDLVEAAWEGGDAWVPVMEAIRKVHKITPDKIYVYVPSKKNPGAAAILGISHKAVKSYGDKMIDPPPGSYDPAAIVDTDSYTKPSDAMPVTAGGEVKVVQPGEEKQSKGLGVKKKVEPKKNQPTLESMVPVFQWNAKYVWVFVKNPVGFPVLMKLTHLSVGKYAKKLVAPEGAYQYAGKIDPFTYETPSDVYPLDWVPEHGKVLAPKAQVLGAMDKGVGKTLSKWAGDTKAKVIAAPSGWEMSGDIDANGFPEAEAPDGTQATVLPNGIVAQWDYMTSTYVPIKLVGSGDKVQVTTDTSKSPISLDTLKPGRVNKATSIGQAQTIPAPPEADEPYQSVGEPPPGYYDDVPSGYEGDEEFEWPWDPPSGWPKDNFEPTGVLDDGQGPADIIVTGKWHDPDNGKYYEAGMRFIGEIYAVVDGPNGFLRPIVWTAGYGDLPHGFTGHFKDAATPAALAKDKKPVVPPGVMFGGAKPVNKKTHIEYSVDFIAPTGEYVTAVAYRLPNGMSVIEHDKDVVWHQSKGWSDDAAKHWYYVKGGSAIEDEASYQQLEIPPGVLFDGSSGPMAKLFGADVMPYGVEIGPGEHGIAYGVAYAGFGGTQIRLKDMSGVVLWTSMKGWTKDAVSLLHIDPTTGVFTNPGAVDPSLKNKPEVAAPAPMLPGVLVPEGSKLIQTSPKWVAETPAGHKIQYDAGTNKWFFIETKENFSHVTMSMIGLPVPTVFIATTSEDPLFPGSLIGKFDNKPGHVLKPNGTIVSPAMTVVWDITWDSVLKDYWPKEPTGAVVAGKDPKAGLTLPLGVKFTGADVTDAWEVTWTAQNGASAKAWAQKGQDDVWRLVTSTKIYWEAGKGWTKEAKELDLAPIDTPVALKLPDGVDLTGKKQNNKTFHGDVAWEVQWISVGAGTQQGWAGIYDGVPAIYTAAGKLIWSDTGWSKYAKDNNLQVDAAVASWPFPKPPGLPPEFVPATKVQNKQTGVWSMLGSWVEKGADTAVYCTADSVIAYKWNNATVFWPPHLATTGKYAGSTMAPEPSAVAAAASPKFVAAASPGKIDIPASVAKKAPLPTIAHAAIPKLSAMDKVGSGKHLGGAGEKDIYKDSLGKQFLFKPAISKNGGASEPFRAYVQAAYASIATKIRPDHIPISVDKVGTKVGTVQPMLELADKKDLLGEDVTKFTDQEKLDVASEHILDWLMSQHDSHPGNMVRTKDGRILSIDKEQGFKYFPNDKLGVDYHPNQAYGEKEPIYNTFWRAFRDGKVEFEPEKLVASIVKAEEISAKDYLDSLRPYLDSTNKSPREKEQFLEQALYRKLRLRQDFEEFITSHYRARTGEEGKFSFASGWWTDEKKFKEVNVPVKDLLSSFGVKKYEYAPTKAPSQAMLPAGADPDITVLKMPLTQDASKLGEFIKSHGLKQIGEVEKGAAYNLAFITTDSLNSASVVQKVPISEAAALAAGPGKYFTAPAFDDLAKDNAEEYERLDKLPLAKTRKGAALRTDGSNVEGTNGRAVRWIDKKGDPYYVLSFKLRPATLASIPAGTKNKWEFPIGDWNEEKKAFDENMSPPISQIHTNACKGTRWAIGDNDVFVCFDEDKYSYYGSVYFRIYKGNPGQAAKDLLDKVKPGLAAEVFRNPTQEEKDYKKARRLLWASSPTANDSLVALEKKTGKPASAQTVVEHLKTAGVLDQLADIVEEETFDGQISESLPGRWRKLAGGKLRMLWQGCSGVLPVMSIIKNGGIMGIHERSLRGVPIYSGLASPESDIGTGAGDQALLRAFAEGDSSFSGHTSGGLYQCLVHPKVCDRLDWFMHTTDCFGACNPTDGRWQKRKSPEEAMKAVGKSYHSGNEVAFRRGVPLKHILRITASNTNSRNALVMELQKAGINEVNGLSIENFVVVETSVKSAYEKYVKPIVGV